MPPSTGDNKKETLPIRISPELRLRLQALQAARCATSLSEAATDALVEGLIGLEEKSYSSENKRLINERLKAKLAGAIEAVTTLEDLAPTLDPADRATVAQVVALLRAWLSE